MNEIKYDVDFYGWTQEQARLLREGRFAELDVVNLVEEVESLGRGEKRELVSRLRVLLLHLLKWQFQPNLQGVSWRLTIENQRADSREHIAENPSLKPQLDAILATAYGGARRDAVGETGLPRLTFPAECPWSLDQVLSDEFLPE